MESQTQVIFLTQEVQQEQMKIEQLEQSVKALEQAVVSLCYGVYDVEDYLFMQNSSAQFHVPLKQLHPVHLCTTEPAQESPDLAIYAANTLEHDKIAEQLEIGFESFATREYQRKQRAWRAVLRRFLLRMSVSFIKSAIMCVSFILSIVLLAFELASTPRAMLPRMFKGDFYQEWFPMIFKNTDNVELSQLQNSVLRQIEQIESHQTGGWCRAIAVGIFGGVLISHALR